MTRQDYRFVRIALVVCAVIIAVPTLGWAQSPIDGFDPGVNGAILAVAIQPDGKILVGGQFTMLGGGGTGNTPRERIGRLNADGSVDTGFNPGAAGEISSLAVQPDGKILVGGFFTTLAGVTRDTIGRLNYDGTIDATFNPGVGDASSYVDEIVVQPDGKILVGGSFTTLGGGTLLRIGRLNANGSLDTSFNPDPDNWVYAIALQSDGRILLGGAFSHLNGVARDFIGRLNADGTLDTTFNPGANSSVETVAVQADGKILVGGAFQQLGGGSRLNIGRLNPNGTLDTDFDPGADFVKMIVVQPDGRILVGGVTGSLAGAPLSFIGRLLPNGALDVAFSHPAVLGNSMFGMALQSDGKVVAFGAFIVNGRRILRLHADGQNETTFNPGTSMNGTVYALAVHPDGKSTTAGAFTSLGGTPVNRIGRLRADGVLDPAVPVGYSGADDIVLAIAAQPDGKVVGGGQFNIFSALGRPRIGRLLPSLYDDSSFVPGAATGNVGALAMQPDGKILAAGGFTQLSGATRWRVARLDGAAANDAGFADPGTGNTVNTIARQPDGRIVVGGIFTSPRTRIGRLEANGTWDPTFNPSADGAVSAVAVQPDGKILVGGLFAHLNGVGRAFIGRLNADGSLDTTFNPGAEGEVSAFAVQTDGKIVIGGQYIGRINANGTYDNAFIPGALGQPHALAIQADGKILVGGAFTKLGNSGTTDRLNIGRLTNTTAATQTLSASAGGAIITWLRGGSSPEVSRVTFEISSDGVTYTPLGAGTRIAGGWRLSGQSPPIRQNVLIRARGHYATGYRNGSESIVESVRNFFFGHSSFTDDLLIPAEGVIKAVHITELRTRIDAVRAREGLSPYTYSNNPLVVGSSVVSATHVAELRTALAEVYTDMGLPLPIYSTNPAPGVIVRADDITSLRAYAGAIE